MNIQWFPGHMAKTRRLLSENLRLVDAVIELIDARIPISSRNPDIDKIIGSKPRITALNKSDLADPQVSGEWSRWYEENNRPCIFIDSLSGSGIEELKSRLRDLVKDKIEKEKSQGRRFRPIRTMVVGIPNVGKSSFINRIAGRASAATGDRPGVTRGKQWIRLNREIELLDTPGILWPKFEDERTGLNLAFTGAIRDEILDIYEVALKLIEKLAQDYPDLLAQRYRLDSLDKPAYEIMEEAAIKRGCIVSGGEIDYMRISTIILDEFRGGKIGRISLERPGKGE